MTDRREAPPTRRTPWVLAWFVADAIVALAPPLYWAADGKTTPILGVPAAVFYFVAVSTFITASIIAAYIAEARNESSTDAHHIRRHCAFFAVVVAILHLSGIRDRNFSEYAVGGRSFGPTYQAMSFLNTWYPGAMFTAFGGMAASAGVISFYVLSYSLLTVVLMYMMAKPVWI